MQTLRIAKVVQRKLNLKEDFLEPTGELCLEPIGEMPVLRELQHVAVVSQMEPEFLQVEASGVRVFSMVAQGKESEWISQKNSSRLFAFYHANKKRHRVVNDGSVNALVYPGMVLVARGRFLQWRDKRLVYLVQFSSKTDCSTFVCYLESVGAVRRTVMDELLLEMDGMVERDAHILVKEENDSALDGCISQIESMMLEDNVEPELMVIRQEAWAEIWSEHVVVAFADPVLVRLPVPDSQAEGANRLSIRAAPALPPKPLDRRKSLPSVPPPPPPAQLVAKRSENQIKRDISSAMAQWIGGSESTLRRVITLSTQSSSSPKSAAMLRSMARLKQERVCCVTVVSQNCADWTLPSSLLPPEAEEAHKLRPFRLMRARSLSTLILMV
jgi:hypothetical protein